MKIGVFAYNFPHKKTFEGIMNLLIHGVPVDCILAADPVKLNFYQSQVRISPKGLVYPHPSKIAARFNIPYTVVPHNAPEAVDIIMHHGLDLGIILGARIIKSHVIDAFKVGILNLHPGLLPENRGLDTVKWAVIDYIPQGATAHLIDSRIDWGRKIKAQVCDVYTDDTLLDILLRVQSTEQQLMLESVRLIEEGRKFEFTKSDGKYNKAVSPEMEQLMLSRFESYKQRYSAIVKPYSGCAEGYS